MEKWTKTNRPKKKTNLKDKNAKKTKIRIIFLIKNSKL